MTTTKIVTATVMIVITTMTTIVALTVRSGIAIEVPGAGLEPARLFRQGILSP